MIHLLSFTVIPQVFLCYTVGKVEHGALRFPQALSGNPDSVTKPRLPSETMRSKNPHRICVTLLWNIWLQHGHRNTGAPTPDDRVQNQDN